MRFEMFGPCRVRYKKLVMDLWRMISVEKNGN